MHTLRRYCEEAKEDTVPLQDLRREKFRSRSHLFDGPEPVLAAFRVRRGKQKVKYILE